MSPLLLPTNPLLLFTGFAKKPNLKTHIEIFYKTLFDYLQKNSMHIIKPNKMLSLQHSTVYCLFKAVS